MKKLKLILGAALLGGSLVACGGAATPGPGGGNPADAPVINSFMAEPAVVAPGGETTLTWDVTGATSLSLAPGGKVDGSSLKVAPSQTTEYTLTARNDAGESTETTTVTVGQVPTQSIGELVEGDPQFSMLAQILAKADLAATLAKGGPYTLFAPNDAAIAYLLDTNLQISLEEFLNRPELADIFKYHILEAQKLAGELKDGATFTTLQGYPVTTEVTAGDDIKVEAATVIERDVLATNGVVHVIDEVLMPPARASDTYSLEATLAEGTNISGTATFNELSPTQTEVVLELSGTSAGATLPAHIHVGNVDSNGAIAYPLESVVGASGKSATTLQVSYEDLLAFDGYINVHLSAAQPDVVVANGEVGLNAVPTGGDARAKATR